MRIENSAFRVLSITGARSSSMLESCTRYVEQNRSLDGTAMTSPACLSCYGTAGTSDGTVQLGETVMTAQTILSRMMPPTPICLRTLRWLLWSSTSCSTAASRHMPKDPAPEAQAALDCPTPLMKLRLIPSIS